MPSEGVMILGALAAFFFCMMFVSWGLKYYFGKKAKEDEENAAFEGGGRGPSASAPGPAAASDVMSERDKLIQGTSDKVGAKTIQLDEVDINVAAPPTIPDPFTINATTPPDYTISFDIKVEKNLPRDGAFTILDRGGSADDNTGRRPWLQLVSTTKSHDRCAKNTCELNGLEFLGDTGSCSPLANALGCQKVTVYELDHANTIKMTHKAAATPFAEQATTVGPQAGEDYKNCTIVVKSTGATDAEIKIFWDSVMAGQMADSKAADWGSVVSKWQWAGGQTAPNANIGAVKVKNAYIFGRALDDSEVAILLNRGASATSTYCAEPKTVSWKFNPSGYESD